MDITKRFKIVQMMSSIRRFSQMFLVRPESVLEHTAVVGLIASFIVQDVEKLAEYKKVKVNIDFRKLYETILYHDIDEVVTGDIPRTTKYADPKLLERFKELEEVGMRMLVNDYELGEYVFSVWKNIKGVGVEGAILKLADIISVVFKVWEEVCLYNNVSMKRVGLQVCEFLEIFKSKISVSDDPDSLFISEYLKSYIEACEEFVKIDIMKG